MSGTPYGRNASGGILIGCETLDGIIKWRHVPDLEHRTLCRAFGLNENVTWYDVPKSFHGGSGSQGRFIEGRIHQGGRDAPPIGKVWLCKEGQKFTEEDPRHMHVREGWRSPAHM